jgi:magnesium chelatase subunit I
MSMSQIVTETTEKTENRPANLKELRESGWRSKSVKREIRDNFIRMLAAGEELFPGIVGYDDTVIPEVNLALLSGHDMLFPGRKGSSQKPNDADVDALPRPVHPIH